MSPAERFARLPDLLAADADLRRRGRWVDVDCGNGAFTELLVDRCAPKRIVAIDPSPQQLAYARQRHTAGVAEFIEAHGANPEIGTLVQSLAKAFGALQLATGFIAQKSFSDPEEAGAASTDYLRMLGLVALGYMWVRMAKVAADKLPGAAGDDAAFYQAKRTTAAFYVDRILPQVGALLYAIKSGKASMMALEEAAF